MKINNSLPFKKLGKYEILDVLGQGGMGTVYKARDQKLDRLVALKTIRADLLSQTGEDLLSRLEREAKAAAKLSHPNIVTVYDFDTLEGTSFIALEYVEGQELKDSIENRLPLDGDEVLRIIFQILDGLSHAHSRGVVHRDIKPANVIELKTGALKISDFGIARVDVTQKTQVGMFLGTPQYVSPEQAVGEVADGRSDLFSVGVILYELLTGVRPFAGDSLTAIIYQVLNKTPELPSEICREQLKPFDAAVEKALAKNPEDRFQSAEEFKKALILAKEGKIVGSQRFSEEELKRIECELANFLGPIAKIVIGKLSKKAFSLNELCMLAAGQIKVSSDRDKFLQTMRQITPNAPVLSHRAPSSTNWEADFLQTVQAELAHLIGPLALHLVKKISGVATTKEELYELLSKYIRREEDRRHFLSVVDKEKK